MSPSLPISHVSHDHAVQFNEQMNKVFLFCIAAKGSIANSVNFIIIDIAMPSPLYGLVNKKKITGDTKFYAH